MEHFSEYELQKYTSFKIGGKVKNVYFPFDTQEFIDLLKKLKKFKILGGMSNVLISSQGVVQDVILTKKYNRFELKENKIYAQAGAVGALLANAAMEKGLSGLEFMCGFPGTIGGIVCMNASANGQALADVFESALVYDCQEDNTKIIKKEDMQFAYRESIIKTGRYVVLEVVLNLLVKTKEEVLSVMEKNKLFRKNKQPNLSMPNCGSVFKNPENDSAGRLLELAGAKGLSCGGARVYENHANFIVNLNNATSLEVSQLMKNMYNKVYEAFGIKLRPEVEYIGIKTKEEEEIWNEFLKN